MDKSAATLGRIFFPQGSKTPEQDTRQRVPDRFDRLTARVKEEIKGISWQAALPELTEKIGELFDIEIPDIMLAAWKKLDALRKYADASQYAPEETVYAELAEHTITGEFHPYLQIQVKNIPVRRIEFTINLSLVVKGMVLRIQSGRIKEIRTGNCEIKGKVEYQDLLLAEKTFTPIELPGSINLGEGIPIAA
jgi:hypothetical protein